MIYENMENFSVNEIINITNLLIFINIKLFK